MQWFGAYKQGYRAGMLVSDWMPNSKTQRRGSNGNSGNEEIVVRKKRKDF
jgi:hypothetical protein